jgi:peroxiredoxin
MPSMVKPQSKPESRWRKYSSLWVNALFIVVAFIGITAFQARNMLVTERQAAPSLRLNTLAGETFDLVDAGARPALVYFFAPWCHYCAASADNLVRLRRLRDEDALDILVVALDWQDVNEVEAYAKRHKLNVPVLLGDATVARDWQVFGFPTYYVLDSDHGVAGRDIGYSTQLGLWWRSWVVD